MCTMETTRPVTVRPLPIAADPVPANARQTPNSAICGASPVAPDKLPATVAEWCEANPTGLWELGAVLAPYAAIVRQLAAREGLAYSEAVQWLQSECFVLEYDSYVESFDRSRGVEFFAYCKIRFDFAVRQFAAHRAKHLRTVKASVTTAPQPLPDADIAGSKALSVVDCQTCKAIAMEDHQVELQRLADMCENLKAIDPTQSFVVWNHTGLGRTYDDLGQYLGMAPKSVKQIHIGGIAALRRLMNVKG